jgi:hypothetical protein
MPNFPLSHLRSLHTHRIKTPAEQIVVWQKDENLRFPALHQGSKPGRSYAKFVNGRSSIMHDELRIIFHSISVAVVVCFFFCWAPFHAQRIMAVYGKIMSKSFSSDDLFMRVYIVLTYISGITYFLSTCINPFLYNIMSHKFRNASKVGSLER